MNKHKIDLERRMDDTKLLWHMDRVKQALDYNAHVAPIHIDMGIAKFCNISCCFCFGQYQQMSKDYIKRDALLQTMKDAGEIGVKSIGFIGDGEPTVNPHWEEALYAGKKAGVSMAISTNGLLVNTLEKRKAILENCDWMRFCLSAGTKEGYKKIHGVDRFDNVVENIKTIIKEKREGKYACDIGLQAVFVPTLMANEMIEESKLAQKLGVDYFVIKQCSLPAPDKKTGMMNFDLNDYDKPEIQEALQTCENLSTKQTKIIVKWNTIAQKGKRPYDGCLSIPLISEMSGNGDWYPCGYMFGENSKFKEEYRFGNVHEQSLKKIFSSSRYKKIIDKMKTFDVHNDCCGSCRQDRTNEFCYNYLNKPKGINFV